MNEQQLEAIGRELVQCVAERFDTEVSNDVQLIDYMAPKSILGCQIFCAAPLRVDNRDLIFIDLKDRSFYMIVCKRYGIDKNKMKTDIEFAMNRLQVANDRYTWLLSLRHQKCKPLLEKTYEKIKGKGAINRGYELCRNATKAELKTAFADLIVEIIREI